MDNKKQPSSELDLVVCLNSVLANEYSLFTKTLNFHWNITGPRFHSLHVFLEGQYQALLGIMDQVAEQIRILGEHPVSTIKGMLLFMDIKDGRDKTPDAENMLKILMNDHQAIKKQIEEIVSDGHKFQLDAGSEDLLVSVLRQHQKMEWMLRSHTA